MSKPRNARNPLYLLAMAFGLAFTLTACAFGVLMLKANRPGALPEPGQSGYALMALLDRHGLAILVGELIGLGLAGVGAIRLDHVRGRREILERERRREEN